MLFFQREIRFVTSCFLPGAILNVTNSEEVLQNVANSLAQKVGILMIIIPEDINESQQEKKKKKKKTVEHAFSSLGPVVQSIVSLTNSLRVILLMTL